RVRDRLVLAALGWEPGDHTDVTVRPRLLVLRRASAGGGPIDTRGRGFLPPGARALFAIMVDDPLLLAADPRHRRLIAFPLPGGPGASGVSVLRMPVGAALLAPLCGGDGRGEGGGGAGGGRRDAVAVGRARRRPRRADRLGGGCGAVGADRRGVPGAGAGRRYP